MPPELAVTIFQIVVTAFVSVTGAWLIFKVNMKRTISQNAKDDIDAAAKALELSTKTVERIETLETQNATLKEEVGTMKVFMTLQRYRFVLEFDDGPALAKTDPLLRVARLERIREVEVTVKT